MTLQQIWNLRKELDHAITSKQFDQITEIKAKYKKMMMTESDLYSRMFTSYHHAYYADNDIQKHNFLNMNSILRNIQAIEKKLVKGENVSVKLNVPHSSPCLAGEIWVLRAMYDKFLLQSKKLALPEWKVQENMILGQAVEDRLRYMLFMAQTEKYHDAIFPLLEEVQEGYKSIYGKSQPKINFSQLSEDYQENMRDEEQ